MMYYQPHGAISGRAGKPPRRILVTEHYHVVRLRNGVADRVLPPGRHWMRRSSDRLWMEAATPQVLVVPSQEVLTADGVTVRATVSYVAAVIDPMMTMKSGDWRSRLHLEIQLALRAGITAAPLEELVASRSALDVPILEAVGSTAAELGVEVEKLAIRDLVVPGEQRKLLAEVVAARLAGQASLERARAETAALRNLANAASMVRDNPALFQLRLLQEISASSGNTFVVGTETIPLSDPAPAG
jgi:regulator of protease activity HflC (stomatin/prohibitin superfamily)